MLYGKEDLCYLNPLGRFTLDKQDWYVLDKYNYFVFPEHTAGSLLSQALDIRAYFFTFIVLLSFIKSL